MKVTVEFRTGNFSILREGTWPIISQKVEFVDQGNSRAWQEETYHGKFGVAQVREIETHGL